MPKTTRPLPLAASPHPLDHGIRLACAGLPVTLVYLFGSHARGTADTESDVDVAVLAAPTLSKVQRHDLRLELSRTIAGALGMPLERIDVVVLQDVPVLLRYNVIRCGRPIISGGSAARATFEVQTEQSYEDERPML